MNYRGSYKKLLGNSQAAMMAAVETYNKPMFSYRDECTVILLLNAWELVLKALLSKNGKSIFYPKKRNKPYQTLSWQDALSQCKGCFPRKIPYLPIQRNLELLGTYRNNAVHFYNAKNFGLILYALTQTSIINYRDFLRDTFTINIENLMSWQLLPIGIRPPIDVVTYISGKTGEKMTPAVRQFLSELSKSTEEIKTRNEDAGRLLTIFKVNLESSKKIGEADATVKIAGDEAHDGPLAFIRTQDPNKSHPWRQTEILGKLTELHGKPFTSHTFQAIVWKHGIKEKPQYCWKASEGVLTRYSDDLVVFIKRLTADEVDTACADYRQFLRHNRNAKVSKR